MKRWQVHRAVLIATAMLMLSSRVEVKVLAQANSSQEVKTYCPGSRRLADGSCWSKVIALLQAKGFHVFAVQNPLTSLADDVAVVFQARLSSWRTCSGVNFSVA